MNFTTLNNTWKKNVKIYHVEWYVEKIFKMKEKERFLKDLNDRQNEKLPFIDCFKNDKYLKGRLYKSIDRFYFYGDYNFSEIKTLKDLKIINSQIEDFKNLVISKKEYKAKEYSLSTTKSIVTKLESIGIPKLTKLILKNFVEDNENINLLVTNVLEFNEFSFKKEYGLSFANAERNFRELKRYADNYITDYLKEISLKEKQLLEKFKHIGFLDYKLINEKLETINTISKKLDYLVSAKENYFDKFQKVVNSIQENENDYIFFLSNRSTFWEYIFGNNRLVTALNIQESTYEIYFKNASNNPEYTYWFLKYNANQVFEHTINSKDFKNKINSNLKNTFIQSELKEFEQNEKIAIDLLLNKKLDIYNKHPNNYQYIKELALLRILDGNYYKENTTESISSWSAFEVQSYYKHILLKPYLKAELQSKNLTKHDENSNDKNGFPINSKGIQIQLQDEKGNILLKLNSNFLISFEQGSCIKFNPNDKTEVYKALDGLIEILTKDIIENINGYFELDLTDEVKKRKRLRTKEPLKILKITMYFDWINNWLNYFGNVFNFEFKVLFYSKFKEKIKNYILQLETDLYDNKTPKKHILFFRKWIAETDNNIELERIKLQNKDMKNNKIQNINKLNISEIVDTYSYLITEEIKNLNTGNGKGYFITNSTRFLNSEFESELKENTEQIQRSIIAFKKKVLSSYNFTFKNDTYLLENDSNFLENLHLYIEYKKLLNNTDNDKTEKEKQPQQKSTSNPIKSTQIQNALYTYYLQKGKYIKYFEHQKSNGKIKEIKKLVEENGYGSSKTFQEKYNLISNTDNRIAINQQQNIDDVIVRLKKYPNSESIAIKELEEINKLYC